MKNSKETTKEQKEILQPIPLDIENEFKIRQLEEKVKALDSTIRTLTVLCDKLAKMNGIKVERYADGLIVISQI